MPHPAIVKDNVAVITGGASGIGFAAATAFARAGMKVCVADVDEARLAETATKLSSVTASANVMTAAVDVSKAESVTELERAVRERFDMNTGLDAIAEDLQTASSGTKVAAA